MVKELVVDDVADGLQEVRRLVEDIIKKEVCLERLVLVAEMEGVRFVVQKTA